MCGHAGLSFKMIYEALKTPMILKMIFFLFFSGLIIPRFQEYKYYYLLDELGFSELEYGLVYLGSTLFFILMVVFFNYVIKKFSYRQANAVGIGMTVFFTFFDFLFYMEVYKYLGWSPKVFIYLTNIVEDYLTVRYSVIAYSVVNARITPITIEASIFAALVGVALFGFGVLGTLHGTAWALYLGLSKENMARLPEAMLIKLAFSLVPFALLGWVPNKDEIEASKDLQELNKV